MGKCGNLRDSRMGRDWAVSLGNPKNANDFGGFRNQLAERGGFWKAENYNFVSL